MKKKIATIFLIGVLTACTNTVFAKDEAPKNTYEINGITITAENFSLEEYNDPNGQYAQQAIINFTIKNDTDNAFGYTKMWNASLADGYELKSYVDFQDMDLKQVPAKSEKEDTATVLIEADIDVTEFEATYSFMDYDAEYWDDLGKAIMGQMTEEEYTEKYGEAKNLVFSLTLDDSTENAGNETVGQNEQAEHITFVSDDSSLEYAGFEFMDYSETETLAVVKFTFSHQTDSPSGASAFYNVKAFQNGVELAWYAGMGNVSCENTTKQVLKDTSIEIGYAFMLQDTENPITLYVYDGFFEDSPCQIQEISIK